MALIFISCNNTLKSTEAENNATQAVVGFYGGEVQVHKGAGEKDGEKKKYFKIEISDSDLINLHPERANAHGGNIAYMFYSNLRREQSKYNEIQVDIHLKNGSTREYKFPYSELKEIDRLIPLLERVNQALITEDYTTLENFYLPDLNIFDHDLEDFFTSVTAEYGKMQRTQLQGFEFSKIEQFDEIIIVLQGLILEKTDATMLYVFDRQHFNLLAIEIP